MPAIVKKVFFKALIVGFPLLYGCGSDSRPQTAVTDNTKSVKRVNDHKLTALERKNNSERLLKEKGVPVLESLPFIDDYTNARFRNEKDVAAKAIVLFGLIHVANGEKSSTEMIGYFKKYNLWDYVSPQERGYLQKENKTEEDNNPVTWRVENLNVLLWALGNFENLPFPVNLCDFSHYKNLPNLEADPKEWIASAHLRDKEDILDETDLILRIHWATTEANLKSKPMPAGINNDVVMERHFALNWLTMYAENWDDVTTDT